MAERTVVVFGAGATKACGGPLTNEILPIAFASRPEIERNGLLNLVDQFLVEIFRLPQDLLKREVTDCPPLPMLLSMLDTALDRKQSFGPSWPIARLERVRSALEYLIFAVLTNELKIRVDRPNSRNHYSSFLQHLLDGRDCENNELTVISLNYDIFADNALMAVTHEKFPDYGCDIATSLYIERRGCAKLFKLHGSLNWMYCPACDRLDLGVTSDGRWTFKVLGELYHHQHGTSGALEDLYVTNSRPCANSACCTPVRPVMITPTHLKDYRNPHIARIWYGAAQALQKAERVHIIGYSLPPGDNDVAYLLKRNLHHLRPERISVVDYSERGNLRIDENEVWKRYRALFGEGIGWSTGGFEDYSEQIQNQR